MSQFSQVTAMFQCTVNTTQSALAKRTYSHCRLGGFWTRDSSSCFKYVERNSLSTFSALLHHLTAMFVHCITWRYVHFFSILFHSEINQNDNNYKYYNHQNPAHQQILVSYWNEAIFSFSHKPYKALWSIVIFWILATPVLIISTTARARTFLLQTFIQLQKFKKKLLDYPGKVM